MSFQENLIFSIGIMLFLITFFSPDEAVTIYAQAVFLFILIVEVIINAIIITVVSVVFVLQSLLDSIVFFLDLNPELK